MFATGWFWVILRSVLVYSPMFRRNLQIWVFFLCLAAGLLAGFLYKWGPFLVGPTKSNIVFQQYEFVKGRITVHVSAYLEKNTFVPGAHYVFEAIDESGNRNEIMTFRHDDPVDIPRENIRYVDNDTAFVFMGWQYAVTTDAGKNWTVWNAADHNEKLECCTYSFIRDVSLNSDGNGKMMINGKNNELTAILQTVDSGRTWNITP